MELIDKEVRYDLYCDKCVHEKLGEEEDPCHDCLNEGSNEYSHKPVYFEAKEGYEDWLPPLPKPEAAGPKNYFDPTGNYSNQELDYAYFEESKRSKFSLTRSMGRARTGIIVHIPAEEAAGKTIKVSAASTTMSTAVSHRFVLSGMTSSNMWDWWADLNTWTNQTYQVPKEFAQIYSKYGLTLALELSCTRDGTNLPAGSNAIFVELKVTVE